MKNSARETKHLDSSEESVESDPASRARGIQARAPRQASRRPVLTELVGRPLVSIGTPADPALLEPTYAYLSAYCFACLPPLVAQRVNVAIYELYANALRYGTERGEVRIELRREHGRVELRVANFAEPSHVERLKAQVGRVQEDASATFGGEMSRFNDQSEPAPMLGIVRVAHEAGLPLELFCEHERVELVTHCDA